MSDPQTRHVIDDLRAGRNGYDAPWAIFDTECVDAVNVDFYKARLGNKRGGMAATTLTSTTRTGVTSSLFRHVPGTDETLAELWAVDDAATPIIERLAGGTAWAAPSIKDAPTGNGWDFSAASINGKLFLAYKSGQDRLHVWDGSTVRRAGLTDIALPSPADTVAGGAYPAVQRYYRVRLTVQVATVTVRRSEPSPGAAFTPSGVNLAVRVTNSGGLPGEGETHWELEASTDNVLYYRIATVVIGTTFYDDSAAVGTYNANPLSALSGTYETQISYKFIAADQNRLLGFGAWNTAQKQARIHISAVIGSLDVGDEERLDINSNYYMDFDESDSGVATGMAGPIFGAFFCFKDRQVWQLTPTGTTVQPYRQEAISKSIGTISHHAIARGEDRHGNAALYWMSHRGMYRWSINGLEYIGRNMEDYVLGPNATINLAATKSVARVAYYADKRQIWCWWATASGNDCNVCAFFDVQTDGWSRVPTGDLLANIRCVAPFATTIAAAMSRDLKLHVGQTGGVTRIWKTDTGTDDNATTYQAYVLTKASEPGGPGFYGGVGDATLLAKAAAGVTITATVTADFGVQSVTGTALLTADGSETRVTRRLEGSALSGDVRFLQYQLGDAAAISNAWTLDRLVTVPTKHEAVSA